MSLDDKQMKFLKKRKQSITLWKFAGPILVVVFIGFVIWLSYKAPLLINPFEVIERLKQGAIEETMMFTMSVLLPQVVLALLFLTGSLILLIYSVTGSEKKYHAIIEQLMEKDI